MHWSSEEASVLVWLEGVVERQDQPEATLVGVGGEALKEECV